MVQLGGAAVYLSAQEIGLGKRESVPDIARNLSRWVDVISARVFSHQTLVEMAAHASVPVINALSDLEHPCQAVADFFTLWERGLDLRTLRLAWVGDGNNVCHSVLLLAALCGTESVVACPPGFEPARGHRGCLPRARRAGAPDHRCQGGGGGRRRDLHGHVDQHGTGSGSRATSGSLPALPGQRDAARVRRRRGRSSCTACPLTAERRSPMRCWTDREA